MSLSRRACLALVVCLPFLSWAQQNPAPAATEQPVAASPAAPQSSPAAPETKVAEGRIHLDVVVTDKSGKPVSGLELKDFTLLDNNLPAKILSFHAVDGTAHKAHPPVEVILLIDTVNETHQQVAFVRQEIQKYLRQNDGHLAQPVSLFVLTNDGVDAQHLPSADGNALAAKVDHLDDRLRTIGRAGGTWGAIERFQFSVKMMLDIANAEAKKPGKKLLIWAGSGWPLLDSPRIQTSDVGQQQSFDVIVQLSNRLREAHISAYSISTGMPGPGTYLYQGFLKGVPSAQKASVSNLGLKVLAVQSGGRALVPDNDLAAQINRCVQDAQAFYTLSFDPPPAAYANEYHHLEVRIDKPNLEIRTSHGYYNQP
jgi:VWFA-related protein